MSNQPLGAEGVVWPRDALTVVRGSRGPATLAIRFRYVMREQFDGSRSGRRSSSEEC
jgi:hypothetical protein